MILKTTRASIRARGAKRPAKYPTHDKGAGAAHEERKRIGVVRAFTEYDFLGVTWEWNKVYRASWRGTVVAVAGADTVAQRAWQMV